MKATHRILAIAAILPFAQLARGAVVTVPNALSTTEGTFWNRYPFGIWAERSMRYQQVYAASEFTSLVGDGGFITEIRFRPDCCFGAAPFSATLSDIQINLSTTSAAPDGLSETFANNVGCDDTVVFARGSLTLSSGFTGPSGGPKAFDIVIPLTTPFLYNPTVGNLLLEVRNFGSGAELFFDAQDVSPDPVSRQYASDEWDVGNVNRATAHTIFPSAGLVTQFVTEPPPRFTVPRVLTNGLVELTLYGKSNGVYAVEQSLDLAGWTCYTNVTCSNTTTTITLDMSGAPHRFFRARQLP